MRRYAPAALLLALGVGGWQLVASLRSVDDLTLASPVEVARALRADAALLAGEALVTLAEVVLGLGIAAALAVTLALVMHLVRPLREAVYPLLVGAQAVPLVVLAPLFVLLFDYGIGTTLAFVTLICSFPIAVTMLDGLRSVEPELLKLMRSLGASRAATLVRVELPAALPAVFSGLRVAVSVSVIAAVFGELAAADRGLGRLVFDANWQLQTPRLYAGVVLLTVMAVALFWLVTVAERAAVPWKRQGASP